MSAEVGDGELELCADSFASAQRQIVGQFYPAGTTAQQAADDLATKLGLTAIPRTGTLTLAQ